MYETHSVTRRERNSYV